MHLSILSIYPSTYLSVCLSICLSVYLSMYIYGYIYCTQQITCKVFICTATYMVQNSVLVKSLLGMETQLYCLKHKIEHCRCNDM